MYDGNVFRLEEHVDRLYDSAKSIMLAIPYSKEELSDFVVETLKVTAVESCKPFHSYSDGEFCLGVFVFFD